MGSTNFDLEMVTDKNLEEVYREACEQARYEEGSDPYNGTISTTRGVRHHPEQTQPVSVSVAEQLSRQRLDFLNKWGEAEGLPLARASDVRARIVKVKVTVPEGEHRHYHAVSEAIWLAAQKRCKPGEHVASWAQPQWDVKLARSVAVTPGTASLRYYITTGERWGDAGLCVLGVDRSGYATKAEARAAAVAAVRQSTDALTLHVTARREVGGNPTLLTVVAAAQSASATVDVTLHRTQPGAARAGWLLYGWAAC